MELRDLALPNDESDESDEVMKSDGSQRRERDVHFRKIARLDALIAARMACPISSWPPYHSLHLVHAICNRHYSVYLYLVRTLLSTWLHHDEGVGDVERLLRNTAYYKPSL